MTQIQIPTLPSPRPIFFSVAACFLAAATLQGQVTNVHHWTTSTQAILSYTAPTSAACTIDVREGSTANPLIHDVDAALFPGSNLDTRTGSIVTGLKRVVVIGKRAAETALDGNRYSRALQVFTEHVYTITCGTQTFSDRFKTQNSPLGMSYNDPLPVDPNQPGQYAWPTINWSNPNQWIVDPQTGFLLKQFDTPRDAWISQGYPGSFASATPLSGSTWTSPASVLADDTAAAVYSGTTQDWLFLELGQQLQNGALHSAQTPSLNFLTPSFNAWCSSTDCTSASAADRSIQFCITTDGVTCASDMLQSVLSACTSNCGTSGFRFAGNANPQILLADWFASNGGNSTIDLTAIIKRAGVVSRTGASVTWVNGDRFSLNWGAGSIVTINGTRYTIASIDSDGTMTLSGSPTGSDTNVSYTGSNGGILVRKMTPSASQISIQFASFYFETSEAETWAAAGDEDIFGNCAGTLVPGPGGELGWHCIYGAMVHWVGSITGTNNRLGRDVIPENSASDGWLQRSCSGGALWDSADGNSFYCLVQNFVGNFLLFKVTYNGANQDSGDSGLLQSWVECGTAPCWRSTLLTPPASGLALEAQVAAFHPEWARAQFKTNNIAMCGRMNATRALIFIARRDQVNNDNMAFFFKFDLNTQRVTGAVPTWHTWPNRWSGSHGPDDLNDNNWVLIPETPFRGPFTGLDFAAGNGPYYSTITSGAVSTAGQACPGRPANSPIAASDWPSGNRCLTITVDGEPGDPTPLQYSAGTVSVSGTTVTGTNTSWTPYMNAAQMQINGIIYAFTYVSSTQGRLDSSPGTVTNSPYILFLEPVNNPKLGNPLFAYLQDAEVRDIFCATNRQSCNPNYGTNEWMRLLIKNGNTWTLQRAYGGSAPKISFPLSANAWLVTQPTSCYFGDTFPCPAGQTLWNANADPYGLNANGNTLVTDLGDVGCCHAARQNIAVDLALNCPRRDNNFQGCYFARFGGLPETLTEPGFLVSLNPPFHGVIGVGFPNGVDSHPSHNQFLATNDEQSWVADARPFLGYDPTSDSVPWTGTAASPGVKLTGNLYKFTSSQTGRLRPRLMPTMAACGPNPLLDISGPASALSGDSTDSYKYCIVNAAGECTSGSSTGDLYVNCPQIRLPYCSYQGAGASDTETRDICVADMGAHTLALTQVGVRQSDPDGRNGRRVSHGLSHYHWLNEFWNAKALPDGHWMVAQSTFLQGLRTSILLFKLPPFPASDGINRADFIPETVTIPAPSFAGVTNAIIQFGYNLNYQCTSRNEPCMTQLASVTQSTGNPHAYQSENPAGTPCSTGCTITIPAISQRMLYYQVLLRDASNNVLRTMTPEVRAIP